MRKSIIIISMAYMLHLNKSRTGVRKSKRLLSAKKGGEFGFRSRGEYKNKIHALRGSMDGGDVYSLR